MISMNLRTLKYLYRKKTANPKPTTKITSPALTIFFLLSSKKMASIRDLNIHLKKRHNSHFKIKLNESEYAITVII